jgi:ubiquinone/menaquinone biosynthesis C-methylase UbiE
VNCRSGKDLKEGKTMSLRRIIGKETLYQDKKAEVVFHKQSLEEWLRITEEGYSNLEKDRYYFEILKNSLELKKSDYVLDVGCSAGVFEIIFRDYSFVGIDISPESIAAAKKIKEKYKLKSEFYVGDMESLKFKDETFDKILCFAALHHLPKRSLENALSECYRVLKPGGIMVSVEPNIINPIALWEHLHEKLSKNEFPVSPFALKDNFNRRFKTVYLRTIKYFPKRYDLLETVVSKTPIINLFGHKILIKAVK